MKWRSVVALWLGVGGWGIGEASAATATKQEPLPGVVSHGKEARNRASVLLVGDVFTADVASRVQARWADETALFRVERPVADVAAAVAAIEALPASRRWHVVVLALPPGAAGAEAYARTARALVQTLRERQAEVVWCMRPAQGDRAAAVAANDAARRAMRVDGVEIADLFSASPAGGAAMDAGRLVTVLEEPLRRALFKRSTPAAKLPPGEKRDPARLLADDALLASPMELREAKGGHAMIYRAEQGQWQFNLHSFLAHHEGKFWAVWSSGRVDEDSSSQFIRYATSADGKTWSESAVLAPDPDGEGGPWRYMASGVYVEDGKLYALGSLNQGSQPGYAPWMNARLVRFEWTGRDWREERVVAEDAVVYFPPLRIEGRDFYVWRDSRAFFYTALAPAGTQRFEVTRVPGPLPDYRMSETGSYVDGEGVVHLIIRDQGYTRRLYHSVSFDAGATWTVPVKTNYPDAVSKNMVGRLSNGWFYLISNPKAAGANARDPLAITFSRDGWTFERPLALRKHAPPLRFKGGAKGPHSYQYSHAIEHEGKLWVIYATNKEDIEVSAFEIAGFGLPR